MDSISVNAELLISTEKLNDAIITAIEGGSNYWYLFNEEASEKILKYKTAERRCFSECILPAIMSGEIIPVHDVEDYTTKVGELSLDGVKRNLQKMIVDGRAEIKYLYEGLFDDDDVADADVADVIFQYLCLGEIVYG